MKFQVSITGMNVAGERAALNFQGEGEWHALLVSDIPKMGDFAMSELFELWLTDEKGRGFRFRK